jgi:hypothetical protein
MAIEVKYKNRDIFYDEDQDVWKCGDLHIEDAKLAAVKRRIDAIGRSERTVNIQALYHKRAWHTDKAETETVTVTVLCDPEPRRYGSGGDTEYCWIKSPKDGKAKVRIDSLIPLDQDDGLREWVRLDEIARVATKAAADALDKLPRHDADSLMLEAKEAGTAKTKRAR